MKIGASTPQPRTNQTWLAQRNAWLEALSNRSLTAWQVLQAAQEPGATKALTGIRLLGVLQACGMPRAAALGLIVRVLGESQRRLHQRRLPQPGSVTCGWVVDPAYRHRLAAWVSQTALDSGGVTWPGWPWAAQPSMVVRP